MYVDGGATAVVTTMQDLGFDEPTIRSVMSLLGQQADALQPAALFTEVSADQFGVTTEHARLGYHAELARQRAAEAILDMVAGLQQYSEALREMLSGAYNADDATVSSVSSTQARLEAAANCINTDAIKEQNVCVAPSTTGGER